MADSKRPCDAMEIEVMKSSGLKAMGDPEDDEDDEEEKKKSEDDEDEDDDDDEEEDEETWRVIGELRGNDGSSGQSSVVSRHVFRCCAAAAPAWRDRRRNARTA